MLVLADGTVFQGKAAGSQGTSFGEIAFNTGMYGYQEIFTDPSYHRQIVVMATATSAITVCMRTKPSHLVRVWQGS